MRYEKITEKKEYREIGVETCGFSNRTYWALKRSGINDLLTLIHLYNSDEIMSIKGIGKLGCSEISAYLRDSFEELTPNEPLWAVN